jgi:hypothetical protein
VDTDTSDTEAMPREEADPSKTGRQPPVLLTSTTKLIQLQKQLKGMVKDSFEFHSTRNWARIITKPWQIFQHSDPTYKTITLHISLFTPNI